MANMKSKKKEWTGSMSIRNPQKSMSLIQILKYRMVMMHLLGRRRWS